MRKVYVARHPTEAHLLKGLLGSQGIEAEKAGNHDGAIERFTHAAELDPACADCSVVNLAISG